MLYLLLALGTLLLAWSNGANDNFKGVATLYGSGTVGFRAALVSTTVATFLGSLLSVMLARSLALSFSGNGAVCFARAVNDTPKIAASILGVTGMTGAMPTVAPLALVALVTALGGWLQSRKVAETMGKEITDLNPGQGLTANLVTAKLVLGASRFGIPVSTTHVSCGSIFGIGVASRQGHLKTIAQIVTTWVATLPLALLLGYGLFRLATLVG